MAQGGDQNYPWEGNDPWYRHTYNSVDEAGTAASLYARSLTVAGGDNYEFGGEIYSYDVDGRVYYGYTTPRQGPGKISFVDSNGNTVTANRGPKPYKSVNEGEVVGYYHSHTGSGDFSGAYQGRGGDALIVTTSQKPLYMARRSQMPFSRKTVMRVMEYDGQGGTTKRTIGKF